MYVPRLGYLDVAKKFTLIIYFFADFLLIAKKVQLLRQMSLTDRSNLTLYDRLLDVFDSDLSRYPD